jgi:hypothetical protein
MAFLPSGSLAWVVASLAVAGLGFGIVMGPLTAAVGGATAVWIRHAGFVAGLLVVTPLLTSDLTRAANKAELRGISTALDAAAPAETKLRLAIDLAPLLARPPRKELPTFTRAVAHEHDAALTTLGRELDRVVQATVTRGFRNSFLLAAALALLAAVPLLRPRLREVIAAAAVGVTLVGTQLASGAISYGARPKLLPPCAGRPGESAPLEALDFVACRLHRTREQFVIDAAAAGASAVDFVKKIERVAAIVTR